VRTQRWCGIALLLPSRPRRGCARLSPRWFPIGACPWRIRISWRSPSNKRPNKETRIISAGRKLPVKLLKGQRPNTGRYRMLDDRVAAPVEADHLGSRLPLHPGDANPIADL